MNRCLSEIGTCLSSYIVGVFRLDAGQKSGHFIYEWHASGTQPIGENLGHLQASKFFWWKRQYEKGELIIAPDVTSNSKKAKREEELLRSMGIRSLVAVPIGSGPECSEFLAVADSRQVRAFNEDDVRLLQGCAKIFEKAIEPALG